mmetsp:Transcript_7508/g.13306  ORF Transcript_7508/g.13306 Transcript_7508/m.13306 type:complete len:211 (+) Transcript_7508:152-784(+)
MDNNLQQTKRSLSSIDACIIAIGPLHWASPPPKGSSSSIHASVVIGPLHPQGPCSLRDPALGDPPPTAIAPPRPPPRGVAAGRRRRRPPSGGACSRGEGPLGRPLAHLRPRLFLRPLPPTVRRLALRVLARVLLEELWVVLHVQLLRGLGQRAHVLVPVRRQPPQRAHQQRQQRGRVLLAEAPLRQQVFVVPHEQRPLRDLEMIAAQASR